MQARSPSSQSEGPRLGRPGGGRRAGAWSGGCGRAPRACRGRAPWSKPTSRCDRWRELPGQASLPGRRRRGWRVGCAAALTRTGGGAGGMQGAACGGRGCARRAWGAVATTPPVALRGSAAPAGRWESCTVTAETLRHLAECVEPLLERVYALTLPGCAVFTVASASAHVSEV